MTHCTHGRTYTLQDSSEKIIEMFVQANPRKFKLKLKLNLMMGSILKISKKFRFMVKIEYFNNAVINDSFS